MLLGFFQVFLVIMPIAVPFFQSKGLSMQDVFSLQALFALVVLVTEVPSGYVADLVGPLGGKIFFQFDFPDRKPFARVIRRRPGKRRPMAVKFFGRREASSIPD